MKSISAFAAVLLALVFTGCSTVSKPERMVGKPAPDFTLPLLNGGSAALKDHLGKHVVILDFWATWCGPCRTAMPIIHEVASQFESQGVVLYAVNQDEDADAINTFFEKHPSTVKVLLDSNSSVGLRYGAEAIPLTIIIDRQGIIRAVNVGASPELKEALTAQIKPLL